MLLALNKQKLLKLRHRSLDHHKISQVTAVQITEPYYASHVEDAIEKIIAHTQGNIVLGIPLGLGKPNQLVNALYQHVKNNPAYHLTIISALSLAQPAISSELERRLVAPILERVFGDYLELDYLHDIKQNQVPQNICIREFFFQPASQLNNHYAQQNYISANYTHVARDLLSQGVNVVAQLISKRICDGRTEFSLSCNPEVILDLLAIVEKNPYYSKPLCLAQVHEQLPFMLNDAQVEADFFDVIIENKAYQTKLFSTPNTAVSLVDHAIGFHASTLVKDNGTLQIGIGSLGDAIANNLILRHTDNQLYQTLFSQQRYSEETQQLITQQGGIQAFVQGLYGCSEMFIPGFMELRQHAILKREVYGDLLLQQLLNQELLSPALTANTLEVLHAAGWLGTSMNQKTLDKCQHFGILQDNCKLDAQMLISGDGQRLHTDLTQADNRAAIARSCLGAKLRHGFFMHGGFFLGHQKFYQQLRDLSEHERAKINMTGISFINDIHWQTELKCEQRQHARYLNTGFIATLLGANAADMLEDGRVISGVGGQYNFVAQAQEIHNGRSILMLRSTRNNRGQLSSNIVWQYGHTTIPRHLRDIYITEYGIADVRGKADSEVIKAMLNISDARFQGTLLQQAKMAGKIARNYQIPDAHKNNTPTWLKRTFAAAIEAKKYVSYPFGSELTIEEEALADALLWLKEQTATPTKKIKLVTCALLTKASIEDTLLLQRMQLDKPTTAKQYLMQRLLRLAIAAQKNT